MFWTDWGHGVDPKIMRASLNGSQILSVVMVNLQEPTGINLDFGNRRIFWVNSRTGIVESVNYDGGNRNVLSQQSGLQPSGLALFPSFLFLTVWKAMKQLDAITGKMLHSYSISDEKPIDIVPYHASRQAPGSKYNWGSLHRLQTYPKSLKHIIEVNKIKDSNRRSASSHPTSPTPFAPGYEN